MVDRLFIYESSSLDPYYNLAVEKELLDSVAEDSCILYLWQNQSTVVIGCNQNPWSECRTSLLETEGGKLARRLSGGGAVFHDTGNLNFTFLIRSENYNLDRQLTVIQKACELAGIQATRSGRNDLLAGGCKFSGNAFYQSKGRSYHHGTILVNADMDRLQRYLSPPKAKLEAKGVTSVRSRVVNLSTLAPGLICSTMAEYMKQAFSQVYGHSPTPLVLQPEQYVRVEQGRKQFASWEHNYGTPLPFTFSCESYFPWGYIQLQLQAKCGIIQSIKVYSDSMNWQLSAAVEQALQGCQFSKESIKNALTTQLSDSQISSDLIGLIENSDI